MRDEEFHERLARASGNRTLVRYIREINERLHVLRLTDFASDERISQTSVQHIEILSRIKARDVAGSRKAMTSNIEDARSNVETTIKEALLQRYLKRSETDEHGDSIRVGG